MELLCHTCKCMLSLIPEVDIEYIASDTSHTGPYSAEYHV